MTLQRCIICGKIDDGDYAMLARDFECVKCLDAQWWQELNRRQKAIVYYRHYRKVLRHTRFAVR